MLWGRPPPASQGRVSTLRADIRLSSNGPGSCASPPKNKKRPQKHRSSQVGNTTLPFLEANDREFPPRFCCCTDFSPFPGWLVGVVEEQQSYRQSGFSTNGKFAIIIS